ncbi:MAG: helix-turn-helix transcriptional regulator [Terrimicrobiaceae bacterium]
MRKAKRELPNRSASVVAGELKRSNGLAVSEIATRLGMSYMGVKAQCLALEKSGYVTSRNQHRDSGRPQLIYRLTAKGQGLYQKDDSSLAISLLHEARTLYGASAAEKLLFLHFQKRTAEYLKQIPGKAPLEERLAALAAQRDAEGHMARVEDGALVEFHVPLAELFEAFPAAVGMEEAMISKILGVAVTRQVESSGEQYRVRFEAFRCGSAAE